MYINYRIMKIQSDKYFIGWLSPCVNISTFFIIKIMEVEIKFILLFRCHPGASFVFLYLFCV